MSSISEFYCRHDGQNGTARLMLSVSGESNPWHECGVIAGIVFPAFELNQNSNLVTAQTRNEIAQSVIENVQMGMDPRLVEAFLKIERNEPLTAEESFLMDQLANATFRLWENTWYQSQKGLFEPDEIEADIVVWRESIREEAFARHWANRRMSYSRDFREVIDGFVESSN